MVDQFRPSRYHMHDLVSLYAAELSEEIDPEDERRLSERRVLDHLCQTAHAAHGQLRSLVPLSQPPASLSGVSPDQITSSPVAMSWFAEELGVLEAAINQSVDADVPSWRLAESLLPFYQRRGMFRAWESSATVALRKALAAGDRVGEARMHRVLAGARMYMGDQRSALVHIESALRIFYEMGDDAAAAYVLVNLGSIQRENGDLNLATGSLEKAVAIFDERGDRRGAAHALLVLSTVLNASGDHEKVVLDFDRAAMVFEDGGELDGLGCLTSELGVALHKLGRHDEALLALERAKSLLLASQNVIGTALTEQALGDTLLRLGQPGQAVSAWRKAWHIYAELGIDDKATEVRDQLVAQSLAAPL
jgi:tetratricopeptide (TPR) repeat protein